jgi:hypothetical protein
MAGFPLPGASLHGLDNHSRFAILRFLRAIARISKSMQDKEDSIHAEISD